MSETKKSMPERCCRKCHFLVAVIEGKMNENRSLSAEDREKLLAGEAVGAIVGSQHGLGCHLGCWIRHRSDTPDMIKDIITKPRRDTCFYHAHAPGIAMGAAEVLEKREADLREAERDRLFTRQQADEDRTITRGVARSTKYAAL